ncbi:MAG: GNAT family N-acetyltransferase [Bacteroidetes bacterium]|nr:GNAT family N-acetyltransferase [Bacteroidota bacterium]
MEYLSELAETTEAKAIFQMHSFPTEKEMSICKGMVKRFGNITAARTDIFPGFSFSRVMGFTEIPERNLISEIMDFFKGRKGIYAIQIPPHLVDEKLKDFLTEKKFSVKNYWARFCRDTDEDVKTKSDLKIREINAEEGKVFAGLVCSVFDMPSEITPLVSSVTGKSDWKHFLAYDNDKPVATGTVFIHGNTAWNCFAASLPEYRGRGAQGALIAERIKAARDAGCKYITSETHIDNESYRNLLRYGFKVLYERPNFVFDPAS